MAKGRLAEDCPSKAPILPLARVPANLKCDIGNPEHTGQSDKQSLGPKVLEYKMQQPGQHHCQNFKPLGALI
jgi:hypothetical protein